MNILIVAPYVTFPKEPGANRFITIARMLSKDHKVTLVTSRFCHFLKKHRDIVPSLGHNIDVILLDEPGYNENVGFSRLISHYVFCKNFFHYMLNKEEKFEIVYSAYPLIRTNMILGRLKNKQGFKLVIDVQDIWPEAILGIFPFLSKVFFQKFLSPLNRYADRAYAYADALIAVSETYIKRADVNGLDPIYKKAIYIGADKIYSKYDSDCINVKTTSLGKKMVAIYIGTMAGSYDLETVVRASVLCKEFVDIKFIGTGPHEAKLRKLNKKLGGNVQFLGTMVYDDTIYHLCQSDLAINPVSSNASVTNKLSDYFCCGLPIVSCQSNLEVRDLLALGGGSNYEAGNPNSLAFILETFSKNREKLKEMSIINSSIASDKFLRENSYKDIQYMIEKLIA